MGTLADRRINDPVLTKLAQGFKNNSLVFDKLFPIVSVSKEGGKIPSFNKEAFMIYNTERAIRAKSNRISPGVHSTIDFVLTEHDLEYPIDYRELDEDLLGLRQHATHVVTDAILLRNEKAAADIAQNTANYDASNKLALSGTTCWDTTTSTPLDDINDGRYAVRADIATFPNVGIIGPQAYKALSRHADILDLIKTTQHAVMNVDLLAQLLNLKHLYIGEAVYADDAGAFTDVWADNMVLAYVPEADIKSFYEPSYGYTLRKSGFPQMDRYDEAAKLELVRNTDLLVSKIVGADAGFLISNAIT